MLPELKDPEMLRIPRCSGAFGEHRRPAGADGWGQGGVRKAH